MDDILLKGIVGSTAYGLNHAGSDIDHYGVYAVPFADLHRLGGYQESRVTREPDTTMHEAAKYVKLALKCNPSVMELLWLTEYEVTTEMGEALIGLRTCFLSERYVRNSYLGYASSQFASLFQRGDGTFSSNVRSRTEKHARHMARLVDQGFDLYTGAELHIRVSNPERYMEFGQKAANNPEHARVFMAKAQESFDRATCALPEKPNTDAVQEWLYELRRAAL